MDISLSLSYLNVGSAMPPPAGKCKPPPASASASTLALFAAAAAGDMEAARAQLGKPCVDVDAYDADGATLTYIAAAHGHPAVVELLADGGGGHK